MTGARSEYRSVLSCYLAGLIFDGSRYAAIASYGLDPNTSAQIWGLFIPSSLTAPELEIAAPLKNQFRLSLVGTPGIDYRIEMTTNLTATTWTDITTNSAVTGSFDYTDLGAPASQRYYRAVKP